MFEGIRPDQFVFLTKPPEVLYGLVRVGEAVFQKAGRREQKFSAS